jgi:pimeloyl-ACP methyl ester carboxylesterase
MGDSSPTWIDYSETAIASDILALVDLLGGGPATLIGNSIAAGAAVCAAADSPERVASLVLVGPFVRNVPLPFWKVLLFRLALARPWGAGTWANYQRTKLYPSTPPADMNDYSERVRAKLREPGRMVAFQRMASTDHSAAESRLGRVRAPGLVVMGTRDPDFADPRAEASLVAQRLGASVALIDGAGHYPQAETPDRFSEGVLGFLGGAADVA